MVIFSSFLAPRVISFIGLLALASRLPLITLISDPNCLAFCTNSFAGRAWSPSSVPTVVSLSTIDYLPHHVRIPAHRPPSRDFRERTLKGPLSRRILANRIVRHANPRRWAQDHQRAVDNAQSSLPQGAIPGRVGSEKIGRASCRERV